MKDNIYLDEALGDTVVKAFKRKLEVISDAVKWINKMAPKINKLNKVVDNTNDVKRLKMAEQIIVTSVKNLEAAVDDVFDIG